MKLTPFGEAVRILRMKLGLTLKSMADALGISSAHLSSIEFGDKKLLDKHIEATLIFFNKKGAENSSIENIKQAADESKTSINIESFTSKDRDLVAAFARKLESGTEVPSDLMSWIKNK
jgi:transcriptional regulator with XRE-family HTH domain